MKHQNKKTFRERYKVKTKRSKYRKGFLGLYDKEILNLVSQFRKIHNYSMYKKHKVIRIKDDMYFLLVIGYDEKGKEFMLASFKPKVFAIWKDSPFRKNTGAWIWNHDNVKRWSWDESELKEISIEECK